MLFTENYKMRRKIWIISSNLNAFAFFLTCCFHAAGNEPAPLASAEAYNPVKQRWECVAPMPTARCSSALLQTPSMLFVIGGVAQGPSNAVEALCLSDMVWFQHRATGESDAHGCTQLKETWTCFQRRVHRWRVNFKGSRWKPVSTMRNKTLKCCAFSKK